MGEVSTKPPVAFKRILGEDYDDGQIVQTIQGTISKLFPAKKGTSSNGEWEFQNGKMKDSEGTEIDISFAKNTQPMTAANKKVTIRSIKTDQHGWNGIKVEDQSYTPANATEPVTKRVLKITATADIVYDGGDGGVSSQPENRPSGNAGAQSQPSGEWKGGCMPYMPHDIHPEMGIADIAHLHSKCVNTVEMMYPLGAKKGEGIPDEMRQSFIASLFIESCRQGLQVNYMARASKPVPPKINPPPADPKDWKLCQIPKGEHAGKTLDKLDEGTLTKYYDDVKDRDGKLANCIKQAFEDLGYLAKRLEAERKQAAEDKAVDPEKQEGDDIPWD